MPKLTCFNAFREDVVCFWHKLRRFFVIGKKQLLNAIFFGLTFLSILLLSSFAFSGSLSSQRTAYAQRLYSEGVHSDNGMIYGRATSNDIPSRSKIDKLITMQNSDFTFGFPEAYNSLWSCVSIIDSDGSPKAFSLTRDKYTLPSTMALVTISGFKNTKRFQSLNLELLKNIEFQTYSNVDGCIFLSDESADYLVKNSGFSTYDQLLDSSPIITIEDPLAGAKKYILINIFYLHGFTFKTSEENYEALDKGNGQKMEEIFNNFAVVYDYHPSASFFSVYDTGLFFGIHSSQVAIGNLGGKVFSTDFGKKCSFSFQLLENGAFRTDEKASEWRNLYSLNTNPLFSGLFGAPFVLCIISFVPFSIALAHLRRQKERAVGSVFLCFVAPSSVFYSLMQFLVIIPDLGKSIELLSLINVQTGFLFFICFLVSFCFICLKRNSI